MTFTPRSIGAPAKFKSWHDAQLDALFKFSDSDERFLCVGMPTGTGKSLLAWSIAAYSGLRTLILTASRYLQDQYGDDFKNQVVDVRGQQNYVCNAVQAGGVLARYGYGYGYGHRNSVMMCDRAPCHHGVRCALMFGGCGYYDAVTGAANWDGAVVSNYSYWLSHGRALMAGRRDEEPLGEFGVLVCDEAHETAAELRKALSVELQLRDVRAFISSPCPIGGKCSDWSSWAQVALQQVESVQDDLRREVSMIGLMSTTADSMRKLRSLREGLDIVSGVDDGSWVLTEGPEVVQFDVVHPKRYAERLLWRGVKKVVLMSATLSEKDVEELGAS